MNNWPYDLLGINEDADERAIKRAYARQLKASRPDEDPEGFQRLNEAYQAALSFRRDTAFDNAEDCVQSGPAMHASPSGPPGPPTISPCSPQPSPNPEALAFQIDPTVPQPDMVELREDLMAHASRDRPSVLRQYLTHHPDLYALETKQRLGMEVFEQIAYQDVRVLSGNLVVLGEFFDFTPPEWLERRTQVTLAVETENTEAFGEERPLVIRQLKRPFLWPAAVLFACMPGFSIRAARLSEQLTTDYGGDVPGLDVHQQSFFLRLADPLYAGAWRWTTILLSSLAPALLIAGLCKLTNVEPSRATQITGRLFMMTAGMLCIWHLIRALAALRERPGTMDAPWIALMPLWLALSGLLAAFLLPTVLPLAFFLLLPAALLYFRQLFDAVRFGIGASWLMDAMQANAQISSWLAALAGAAIGMTTCDWLYARRHRVSLAAATGNRWTTITSFVFFFSMGIFALAQWMR